ncbi:MAG: ABC transporter ATP-binding protein [Turicibacter sp.]|nr:ABC transporter ATP-binding protein [Turicibacter sp.]
MRVDNIHKSYKENVLNGISFEVERGEIIGIAGKNGSGKSTLLAIMAGIIKPDRGTVVCEGSIGYVPQTLDLFENLTVRDNLRFWMAAYGIKSFDKCRNPITTSIFDDEILLKKRVRHLSGGMKKRLSIALSCLNNPDYLIMDEPSSALDIEFKRDLHELIKLVAKERSVIFTSHQPDELAWCGRVFELKSGLITI